MKQETMNPEKISAQEAKARLQPALDGKQELAFLDLREAGQYGEGHPFFIVNLPYSRLEILAPRLLPRLQTPLVLMDEGDGVAEKAARRFSSLGYKTVAMIEGGAAAWSAAGFGLFKGVNLPSKAFGEMVEAKLHTPAVSAERLAQWLDEPEPPLVLDGRAPQEFAKMSIPSGRACANAELAHRLASLLDRPHRPVVVNCAGRTRSIIGAQTLINAGFKNPVFALENGTQGWELAGLTLNRGNPPEPLPDLTPEQEAASRARAEEFRGRYSIPTLDWQGLERARADQGRSLYLLDVRTREEFEAGHLSGAQHAPGGQLVQATDAWVGVRGALLVLCDDTGLRAATTAAWLRGMGHDAVVLEDDVRERNLEPGAEPPVAVPGSGNAARITPDALKDAPWSDALLLNLSPSMAHRKGHPPAARWVNRARLGPMGEVSGPIALWAEDPRLAEVALLELEEAAQGPLALVEGGASAWDAAGLPFAASPQEPADSECIDYLFFVHDRHDGNLDSARAYLAWETGLLERMDESERAALRPPE